MAPRKTASTPRRYGRRFDSIGDFAAWLENTPVNGYFAKVNKESSRTQTKSFTGSASYEDATRMLIDGWADGAAKVRAAMVARQTVKAPARRIARGVVGFAPCVPAYLAGDPLSMYRHTKTLAPARILSVALNMTVADDGTTPEQINETMATVFNVVTGLELAGCRVELWATVAAIEDDETATLAVKVKSAGQPFNLVKMCYPCAHPSMLRRHYFAFMERAGVIDKKWLCYGRIIRDAGRVKSQLAGIGCNPARVLSFYDCQGKTEKEIAAMLADQ